MKTLLGAVMLGLPIAAIAGYLSWAMAAGLFVGLMACLALYGFVSGYMEMNR